MQEIGKNKLKKLLEVNRDFLSFISLHKEKAYKKNEKKDEED